MAQDHAIYTELKPLFDYDIQSGEAERMSPRSKGAMDAIRPRLAYTSGSDGCIN